MKVRHLFNIITSNKTFLKTSELWIQYIWFFKIEIILLDRNDTLDPLQSPNKFQFYLKHNSNDMLLFQAPLPCYTRYS